MPSSDKRFNQTSVADNRLSPTFINWCLDNLHRIDPMGEEVQMESEIIHMIHEAIRLELNTARLYALFAENLYEDESFWRKLSHEERNHAALIRTIEESVIPFNLFNSELLSASVRSLETANQELRMRIEAYEKIPPSRNEAFNFALFHEKDVGEFHYQKLMAKSPSNTLEKIFQELGADDRDHEQRLIRYMQIHSIPESKNFC